MSAPTAQSWYMRAQKAYTRGIWGANISVAIYEGAKSVYARYEGARSAPRGPSPPEHSLLSYKFQKCYYATVLRCGLDNVNPKNYFYRPANYFYQPRNYFYQPKTPNDLQMPLNDPIDPLTRKNCALTARDGRMQCFRGPSTRRIST